MKEISSENKGSLQRSADKFSIDAGIVLFDFLTALSGEMYSSDMMLLVLEQTRTILLKRGYEAEDVDKVVRVIAQVLSSRRSKGMQEFMG